jgi:SAM-dependent methyltransferase
MPEQNDLYTAPDLYDLMAGGVDGDVAYFSKLAAKAGRVLELAAGTGRVTIPMARVGAKVTGLELRQTMLNVAAAQLAEEKPDVRKRVKLVQGDMRDFHTGRTFPLIVIPFRAFQHLHEVADQRACLTCCREHLTRQGRLVVNLFDPNLRILGNNLDVNGTAARLFGEKAVPGGRIVAMSSRITCPEEQRFEETITYEMFDKKGASQWRRSHKIHLRYFFRYEMEHLFELAGLQIEKLEGGFKGQPYKHGGEQLWTVKRS